MRGITGGGCTGASGRGGISARGRTGGGGVELGGCPSASRNLRTRSASDSRGARGIGRGACGFGDAEVSSESLFRVLFTAFDSSWNNAATAISTKKIRLSMLAAIIRYALLLTGSDSTIQKFTTHVPSVRGLSPPAMDSRMEVSACTFFIR